MGAGSAKAASYTILVLSSRKWTLDYKYISKFKCELIRMRKEVITNYKLERPDKHHKYHKIQVNSTTFLLINIRHISKVLFPCFWLHTI